MNLRILPVIACAALAVSAAPSFAFDPPSPADTKLVADCVALAASNDAARPPHDADEMTETPGAAGRLASAAALAPTEAESCIGVVYAACLQDADHHDDDASHSDCATREAAVWDRRLNAGYKAARAAVDPDAAANLTKVQKAWIAYRDASCAQPYITFKGTMAGPMEAWCQMNLTARQALWMESWANNQ